MTAVAIIDVASLCTGWITACTAAETLVRCASELALARGSAALGLAWRGPVELGITLADAANQRHLNRDYRGLDAPTNVLAFPAWKPENLPPPGVPVLLGDVVLALETIVEEASQQNKPLPDHIQHLTVHGVLHILGYDHLAEADAEIMESLERSILAELGVPDPYRDAITVQP